MSLKNDNFNLQLNAQSQSRLTACVSRKLSGRNGFTLTEMLVVIGLIILLLSMALPAFNFMSGSNSLEGTSNMLNAVLAQVRQDAIGRQSLRGVVFFQDVDNDRLVAAFVENKDMSAAWSGAITYHKGDYVIYNGSYWICIRLNSGIFPDDPVSGIDYWRKITLPAGQVYAINYTYPVLDIVASSDRVFLPKGVAVRGTGGVKPNGVTTALENFPNPAVFIFDGNGQLVHQRYCLLLEGTIGKAAQLVSPPGPATVVQNPLALPATLALAINQPMSTSQMGLVMFKAEDATGNNSTDAWFTENGRPYLINRYNGTLMKGE